MREERKEGILLFLAAVVPVLLDAWLRSVLGRNEMDVLCGAKQFMDRGWLPGDWYLNLPAGYRGFFFVIAGSLAKVMPLPAVSIAGRFFLYGLFAWALSRNAKDLRIPPLFLVAAAVFFSRWQSLAAGEWMLGGFDTKTFAYAFILLGLHFIGRRDPVRILACAGLAVSFHFLVGVYGCFALLCALIAEREGFRDLLPALLKRWWIFIVAALPGVWAMAKYLIAGPGAAASAEADLIYVLFRVPHHVLPSEWKHSEGSIVLAILSAFFAFVLVRSRNRERRLLSAFALGGGLFFAVGLLLSAMGKTALLKYYWFRFADTVYPYATVLLAFSYVSDLFRRGEALSGLLRKAAKAVPIGIALIALVLADGEFVKGAVRIAKHPSDFYFRDLTSELRDALLWIRTNTPRDAVFLVPPFLEKFNAATGRAVFVSFKNSPQSPVEILEWYGRLKVCNGGNTFKTGGFAVRKELDVNYPALGSEVLDGLRKGYGVRYYLSPQTGRTGLTEAYANSSWVLYDLAEQKEK